MADDAGAIFSGIYDSDHWRGGSGEGSTPASSVPYRATVATLLTAADIRSVVDVGCGDWQVGSLIDWSAVDYTGVDVVPSLVEDLVRLHSRPGLRFVTADARLDILPRADLLLVKDVLQHWPTEDVRPFLSRAVQKFRYVLATNDVRSTHWTGAPNEDIPLGGWRTLDLAAPPIGLRPLWTHDYEVDGGAWVKRMSFFTSRRWTAIMPSSATRLMRIRSRRPKSPPNRWR